MFMDNLHGQTTTEMKEGLRRIRVKAHYGPARMTDDWQVVDKGFGKAVKEKMAEALDDMFYEKKTSPSQQQIVA